MNTRAIEADQFEVQTNSAAKLSPQILTILAAIPAQFRNARFIERQAKRFYAMNDADLGKIGLNREAIPARLIEAYAR